jgi:cyclase
MLKRISACIVVKNGDFTRTKNFKPDHLYSAVHLDKRCFDELTFINISEEFFSVAFLNFLKIQIKDCYLPISIGGGIKKIEEVDYLFDIGADRIILNEALWSNTVLVEQVAKKYGSQAVVASIDVKRNNDEYYAFDWRKHETRKTLLPDFLISNTKMIGEIFLQSVDRDGSVKGFDKMAFESLKNLLTEFIPINIASGFGKWDHYSDVLGLPEVDCVSIQNVHHMSAIAIQALKSHCKHCGISVR